MTPSKYRSRPRIIVDPKDNDSENEENDEPRRGTRKRAPANYCIEDIFNEDPLKIVTKPKTRGRPRQKILVSEQGEGKFA